MLNTNCFGLGFLSLNNQSNLMRVFKRNITLILLVLFQFGFIFKSNHCVSYSFFLEDLYGEIREIVYVSDGNGSKETSVIEYRFDKKGI